MSIPLIKLSSGAEIPQIGLGTWQSPAGQVEKAVAYALKEAGYRHVDCAFAYCNEKEVGQGIKDSGVPRSELFITSKVPTTWMSRVEAVVDITLRDLGTDYLDLLLMHWPIAMNPDGNDPFIPLKPDGTRDIVTDWPISETWKQMEALVAKGKVKSIGVSNFSQLKLEEELLPFATIPPAVDQLELHPYNPQHKLTQWLKSKGIVPQAYSPLGGTKSTLLTDDVVVEIAQKRGVSPAEVLVGWSVAKGFVLLPKSVTSSRISSNLKYATLDASDVEKLDGLAAAGKQHRFVKPPWKGVKLGFEDWYIG